MSKSLPDQFLHILEMLGGVKNFRDKKFFRWWKQGSNAGQFSL
ncbi:hypothetical protein KIS1582_4083 [Cytobacillus firmus]|uniref:Uncharacterized protein n=1 Tax=Cytobacillus firmus TaxID=1399 RepID=A0A800MTE0_CYTFI|nr:hypothetical protein KIS1582_4083 [Cytobacillus firmus]